MSSPSLTAAAARRQWRAGGDNNSLLLILDHRSEGDLPFCHQQQQPLEEEFGIPGSSLWHLDFHQGIFMVVDDAISTGLFLARLNCWHLFYSFAG